MNKCMIVLLLGLVAAPAFMTTSASAVVYCAAGVYRAGCVVRPVVAPVVVAPRAVVVVPRPVVVAPRRRVY
jgi:hypothetical protein